MNEQIAILKEIYKGHLFWRRPLLHPYNEEEVCNMEVIGEFTFPPLMRWYLLNISREIACHSYRQTIEVNYKLNNNTYLTDDILAKKTIDHGDIIYINDEDEAYYEQGTIDIGTRGCDHECYLVVKGLAHGMVLEREYDYTEFISLFDLLKKPNPLSSRQGNAAKDEELAVEKFK